MIPEIELMRAHQLAQAAAMVKPVAIIVIGAALLLFPAVVSISNLRLEFSRRRAVTPEQRRRDSELLAYLMGELEGEKRMTKKLRKSIRRELRRRSARKTPRRERIAA